MARTGLAALTGGIKEGYEFVDERKRERQVRKALDYEIAGRGRKSKADEAMIEFLGEDFGSFEAPPPTYGERLGGYLKGKIGGFFGGGQQQPQALNLQQPQQQVNTQGVPDFQQQDPGAVPTYAGGGAVAMPIGTYKHGGAVRHMIKKYSNGGYKIPRPLADGGYYASKTTGGYSVPQPLGDGGRTLSPHQGGPGESRVTPYRGGGLVPYFQEGGGVSLVEEIARRNAEGRAVYERRAAERALSPAQIAEARAAETAAGKGRLARAGSAVRRGAARAGKAIAPIALGATAVKTAGTGTEKYRERFALPRERDGDIDEAAAEYEDPSVLGALTDPEFYGDVGVRALGAASELGSALTFGGADRFYRDEQAEAIKAIPTEQPPEQAVAAQPAPAPTAETAPTTPTGPTAPAAATNIQGAGPPDSDIVDFSQVRQVMPEDMPSQTVKDWAKRRKFFAAHAVANGRSPQEAMKEVDEEQMRGFQQYGQQAFQMLRGGNPSGAARALYAAYQYFPNGTDVRFGIQKGKDGRPVLVGMGTDEETGEPIEGGTPMVITAESLATQIENMSNPAAFRTWTKDWHEMEQEIRKYEEIEKPTAQADITYKGRAGRALETRAAADVISATRGGGMKQTDIDKALSVFQGDRELQALLGGEDEITSRDLEEAMATMYIEVARRSGQPGNSAAVKKYIMDSYNEGGMDQVNQDLAELGIR